MKFGKPLVSALIAASLMWASAAQAHCDTLDGPVVAAGRAALDSGNVNLALVWVRKADEPEVRASFQKALELRRSGGTARQLGETYFHETLVRVHRAAENAPYTGLKPAGTIEPAVAAADKAIASGKLQGLRQLIVERTEKGLHEKFDEVMARRKYDANDVEAGRAFTSAYVGFVHYAEGLYEAAAAGGHGQAAAAAPAEHKH